jgi:hypothetical protein
MATELTNQIAKAKESAKNGKWDEACDIYRAVIDSKESTYPLDDVD